MVNLAVLLGRFIGAVLAECGPVIVEILQSAFNPTAEDSKAPDALSKRLHDRLSGMLPDTSKDNLRPSGDASKTPGDSEKR